MDMTNVRLAPHGRLDQELLLSSHVLCSTFTQEEVYEVTDDPLLRRVQQFELSGELLSCDGVVHGTYLH
jgi:hypothetical protein